MKPDKQHWDAETLLPNVLFHPKAMSKNIFFAQVAARAPHCLNPWSEEHLPAETSNSISFYHIPDGETLPQLLQPYQEASLEDVHPSHSNVQPVENWE